MSQFTEFGDVELDSDQVVSFQTSEKQETLVWQGRQASPLIILKSLNLSMFESLPFGFCSPKHTETW